VALLLSLKDFRLLAVLPIVAAIFFAFAPGRITARLISTFDLKDPTNRDRLAMVREGEQMIRAHPSPASGRMVWRVYAAVRDPTPSIR
jgi:O-antigen ligase